MLFEVGQRDTYLIIVVVKRQHSSGAKPIVSMLMLTTTGGDLVGVRRCRSNYTTSLRGGEWLGVLRNTGEDVT